MSARIRDLAGTRSRQSSPAVTTGWTDYTFFTDEQLVDERDRQQAQLDELETNGGAFASVHRLRADIEREVESMTAELKRRARSRHPSSRALNDRMRPLRLLSRPSDPD